LRIMNAVISCPTELTMILNKTDNLCFGDQNSTISTSVSGSVPPYTYLWSDGSTTDNITGLADGSYSVTVTDSGGCTRTAGETIITPVEISIDFSTVKEQCNGSNDGEIHLEVSGGIKPYTFIWPEGSFDTVATGLHKGIYDISVIDDNNCEKSVSVQLKSVYDFCLIPASVLTPNGDGKNDFWRIEFIELNPDATVIVFNRNGRKVFESANYNNNIHDAWDGTNNGTLLPIGSYYYIITMGNSDPFTGYVDIIR
ncbi:MAG: gliding motility-associated C-terminal domain-containing protein, partial [Bacteroidota bacterium]